MSKLNKKPTTIFLSIIVNDFTLIKTASLNDGTSGFRFTIFAKSRFESKGIFRMRKLFKRNNTRYGIYRTDCFFNIHFWKFSFLKESKANRNSNRRLFNFAKVYNG